MYGNMTVRASPKAKASASPPFWHNSHVDVLVTSHKLRTLPGRFVFAHGPTSEPARPDQLHAGSYTRYPKWLDLWSSTSFGNTSVTLVTPGGELCYGTLQHPHGWRSIHYDAPGTYGPSARLREGLVPIWTNSPPDG
jgi:hypothetical protein